MQHLPGQSIAKIIMIMIIIMIIIIIIIINNGMGMMVCLKCPLIHL